MDSFAGRIRRATPFRGNEAGTAMLMFSYSFMAMTAYNILKPLTRSKFIFALGADNLPYVQLAAGLLIGVLMHFYGVAIQRLPRRSPCSSRRPISRTSRTPRLPAGCPCPARCSRCTRRS